MENKQLINAFSECKKEISRLKFTISDYKSRENGYEIKIFFLESQIKRLKNRNLFQRIFNL